MQRLTPKLRAAALAMASLLPAAPALAAYECINDEIPGISAPEARANVADREARRSWEHAARSKHGFNYRWALAYKVGNQPITVKRGATYVGTAKAFPCRIKVSDTDGQILVSRTEAERACNSRPGFELARRHNCRLFYLLGE
ncbi:MAG: hypothetical protein ACK4GO_18045 [Gemmobacter sp.]